jgi:hypothetical protein
MSFCGGLKEMFPRGKLCNAQKILLTYPFSIVNMGHAEFFPILHRHNFHLLRGGTIMEYRQINKGVIDFQKLSFDNWYSAVSMVQDQAASTMDMMLNQATWIPEDGRNAIQNWIDAAKDERERFKSYVDKSFATFEKSVLEPRKTSGPAKKPANPTQG